MKLTNCKGNFTPNAISKGARRWERIRTLALISGGVSFGLSLIWLGLVAYYFISR